MFLVQHFCGHNESFPDVHVGLRRSFYKVLDLIVSGESLSCLCGYLTFRLAISLIPHKYQDSIWLALCAHLIAPMSQISEAGQTSHTVGQKDCMRASVEDLSNALEGFLTGRVPNLKFEY